MKQVLYKLPSTDKVFVSLFLNYLSIVGQVNKEAITLEQSSKDFFPSTSILFTNIKIPHVAFVLSDNSSHSVEIVNSSGISKESPHQYTPIALTDFIKRISPFRLHYIDHTGFNLPYFDGIHPTILQLREKLKGVSLYHRFPKRLGMANWDFILPASESEIGRITKTDYSLSRRPKIEIVSFEKSSTPLIQFDLHVEGRYEDKVKIFPEAIQVPEINCLWVYIQNDFGIDVCFVLNETHNEDWSHQFADDRLY